MSYGGIEAGGTKWVCAVADQPGRPDKLDSFPTTSPEDTVARAVRFFTENGPVEALGVGSFGPVDIRPDSPTWGTITTTPKPGWGDTDVVAALRSGLRVPIALDTDVNVAALGEWRWGAAAGLDTFCYITVGTGIGGGAVENGRLLHGLLHPEFGHMRIPHDRARDPFDGICPYHGDCLEGLASGEAIRQRWGRPGQDLSGTAAWETEAEYLALALVNVVCAAVAAADHHRRGRCQAAHAAPARAPAAARAPGRLPEGPRADRAARDRPLHCPAAAGRRRRGHRRDPARLGSAARRLTPSRPGARSWPRAG